LQGECKGERSTAHQRGPKPASTGKGEENPPIERGKYKALQRGMGGGGIKITVKEKKGRNKRAPCCLDWQQKKGARGSGGGGKKPTKKKKIWEAAGRGVAVVKKKT